MSKKINENNYTVYMHISPSGKRYIGITSVSPKKRWQNGFGYKGQVFYKAIEKYGWDNIEHIIIETNLSQDEACRLEIDLIKQYKTTDSNYGYNVSLGGDKTTLGYHHTNETKIKMSQKAKERFLDKTKHPCYGIHRYGEDSSMFGKKHSKETKEKISKNHADVSGDKNPFYNKHHTEESKKKISLSHIGKKHYMSKECKEKMILSSKQKCCIPILCTTNNTVYASSYDAARELGLYQSNISSVCKKKLKTTGGYCFEYYDINKQYDNIFLSDEFIKIFLNCESKE